MNDPIGNEFERLREANTFMFVRTDRRLLLQQNGMVRFTDFISDGRGELVNAHGRRRVFRVTLASSEGPRTVFLKRSGPTRLKDALKDLLLLRRVRTRALVEFEMLCAFRAEGLGVSEPVACGERHVLGRDRASFLMVEQLGWARPLDEVLPELTDPDRRRRLIASTAVFVRRMHAAAFTHTDLFAKHLFVEERKDGTWSVAVIDLQRSCRRRPVQARGRGRDLAALLVSMAPHRTTARERRTFLLEYLGKSKLSRDDLRFVRKAILPSALRLSRRSAYRAWQPLLEHS